LREKNLDLKLCLSLQLTGAKCGRWEQLIEIGNSREKNIVVFALYFSRDSDGARREHVPYIQQHPSASNYQRRQHAKFWLSLYGAAGF
jgi:hypothetical protein